MKKFITLILTLAVLVSLMVMPTAYALGTEPPKASGALLYQVVNPDGSFANSRGSSHIDCSTPTDGGTPATASISGTDVTGARRIKINNLKTGLYSVTNSRLDLTLDWKNTAAIEGYISFINDTGADVTDIEIGIAVNNQSYNAIVTVPIEEVGIKWDPTGDSGAFKWQRFSIPLSALTSGNVAFTYNTGGVLESQIEWNRVSGFAIRGKNNSDSQPSFCYFTDIKFIKTTAAPANLYVDGVAVANDTTISWAGAAGAVRYIVSRGEVTGADVSGIIELDNNAASTSYTDTSAENDKKYIYYVQSVNSENTVSHPVALTLSIGSLKPPVAQTALVSQLLGKDGSGSIQPFSSSVTGADPRPEWCGAPIDTIPEGSYPDNNSAITKAARLKAEGFSAGQDIWHQYGYNFVGSIPVNAADSKNSFKLEGYVTFANFNESRNHKIAVTVWGSDSLGYMLAVPLNNYITFDSAHTSEGYIWQKFSIPLSEFENGEFLRPNHTAEQVKSFNWASVNSATLLFECKESTWQIGSMRIADLKYVSCITAPKNLTAAGTPEDTQLSWEAVDGASYYKLFRGEVELNSSISNVRLLDDNCQATSYTDTAVEDSVKYIYYVQAFDFNTASEPATCIITADFDAGKIVYKNQSNIKLTSMPLSGSVKAAISQFELTQGSAVLITAIYQGGKIISISVSNMVSGVGVYNMETPLITVPTEGSGYSMKAFLWDDAEGMLPYLTDVYPLN